MHGEKSKWEQHMYIKHAWLNPLSLVKPLPEHTQTDTYENTYASLMRIPKQMPCSAILQRTMQLWMPLHFSLSCRSVLKNQNFLTEPNSYLVLTEGHLLYQIWPKSDLGCEYDWKKRCLLHSHLSAILISWWSCKCTLQSFRPIYCTDKKTCAKTVFYQTLSWSWWLQLIK